MTALRFDVDDIIATRGHYGELSLLRPRTKLGERLRDFVAPRVRALLDERARRESETLQLRQEVEGLRAQNEWLTDEIEQKEQRAAHRVRELEVQLEHLRNQVAKGVALQTPTVFVLTQDAPDEQRCVECHEPAIFGRLCRDCGQFT